MPLKRQGVGFISAAQQLGLAVAVYGGLCAFHADPQRAAQLGRMGGSKNRRHDALGSETEPLRPPQTAKEVKDLLAEAMAGIHAGRLEPRMGSVIAYLGTALLKAMETTDYQERIEALEEFDKKD